MKPEYLSDLRSRTSPWPQVHCQYESWECAARVDFLPAEQVQSGLSAKYPTGCFILYYPGGGLITVINPDEHQLLAEAITEASNNPELFWSSILGRDITAPNIFAERKKISVSRTKTHLPTENLSLSDLGL